ncbi:MAG TPA: SDR family oxidoreductase [Acidimicrobiales bacterium]|nr:SDR family oxidoreductase [Acidimicrobiales bacterium]
MTLDPNAARLDGRVAIVTGGGSGIGRGIAEGFVAYGARVAVWEHNGDRCKTVAASIGGLGVHVDVRDSRHVYEALAHTIDELGVPSILVNNAGGVFAVNFLDGTENGWDALYRANLKHVMLCSQRVARVMRDNKVGGSIINVTSIEGSRAAPGYAAYAAAKAGVINLTMTTALELAPYDIRVNALAPDVTLTEGMETLVPPASIPHLGRMVPMRRVGHVDEMAGAAVFLASNLSSYITGQTIHVDGGTFAAGGWYPHPDTGNYILGPPA